ncbi:MAG: DUF4258 domain-containing protein [Methanothrix sp.]|nr:DUF4258 domain-containing protein [Methanothrix sp.]
MDQRCISEEMVRAALTHPDNVDSQDMERKIAQRLIDSKLLRVIYEEEDDAIIVVSTYCTSKVGKYFRRRNADLL